MSAPLIHFSAFNGLFLVYFDLLFNFKSLLNGLNLVRRSSLKILTTNWDGATLKFKIEYLNIFSIYNLLACHIKVKRYLFSKNNRN